MSKINFNLTNKAVYKSITDVAYEIKQEQTTYILQRLMLTPQLTNEEINLIYELGRLQSRTDPIISDIVEFYFRIYCSKVSPQTSYIASARRSSRRTSCRRSRSSART